MIRKLSVYMIYQERKSVLRHIALPQIRLQGKWLEKAGFSINDKIIVKVSNGSITIDKVEKERLSEEIILSMKQFTLNL